jgi:hypothetical protein
VGAFARYPSLRDDMSIFKSSPEDNPVYTKWCRGIFVFYVCISLTGVVVLLATHFARSGLQFAGN